MVLRPLDLSCPLQRLTAPSARSPSDKTRTPPPQLESCLHARHSQHPPMTRPTPASWFWGPPPPTALALLCTLPAIPTLDIVLTPLTPSHPESASIYCPPSTSTLGWLPSPDPHTLTSSHPLFPPPGFPPCPAWTPSGLFTSTVLSTHSGPQKCPAPFSKAQLGTDQQPPMRSPRP